MNLRLIGGQYCEHVIWNDQSEARTEAIRLDRRGDNRGQMEDIRRMTGGHQDTVTTSTSHQAPAAHRKTVSKASCPIKD